MRKNNIYNSIFILCLLVLSSSIPFDLFIKNKDIIASINILLKIAFIIFILWFMKKENMPSIEYKNKKHILLSLPLFILPFSNLLVALINQHTIQEFSYLSLILNGFLCLLVAISEEIVFRNIIYKYLKNQNSILKSILLSSLFFGLMHLLNISSFGDIIFSLIQVIYTFGLGLIFALLYELNENIILPITLHFLFNFINDTLVTNLFNLAWNTTFYIVNISFGLIVGVYTLILYLKFIKIKEKQR